MRIFTKSKEQFVFLLLLFISYLVLINAIGLGSHKETLGSGEGLINNVKNLVKSGKPKELFGKISKVLKKIGPLKMSISALISNFTMNPLAPKEESAELKALNEGFEKLNDRLDILTSKIGSLDNLIEISAARSAYVQIVSTIKNLDESLKETNMENTKEAYAFFARQYDKSYKFAAANLYDALSGSTGTFGFDLIKLYKNHVKCNTALVTEFCVMGMHLINKGLSIEGAYLGFIDFGAKIEGKMETWKGKLEELSNHCESTISQCENSWKEYAYQQFTMTHDEIGDNNQEFADKLAKALNNVVPHRSWFTVAYNDASGFGDHCYSTYYETEKIWNKKGHDVTIFSTPKEEQLTGDNFNSLKNLIDTQKALVSKMENCNGKYLYLVRYKRGGIEAARAIVDKVREQYHQAAVYAINMNFKPGYAITGNTLYATEQKFYCGSVTYKVLIFQ